MKSILVVVVMLSSVIVAHADGSGSGSGSGSGVAAGCQPADHVDPFDKRPVCSTDVPSIMPRVPTADPKSLRKICVDAMNADATFAADIVKKADAVAQQKRDDATVEAHKTAASEIAVNERQVVLAYAAMWIIAAAFVIFLWRRQRTLVAEIGQLRADLTRATTDDKAKS